jgi:DNA-binding beta-propeller fold protein YncE
MSTRWFVAALALSAVALVQEEKKKNDPPKYPHIDTSLSYSVDAAWPKKPDRWKWGHMPGVAVDKQDRVWLFTREKPPVQCYGTDGNLILAWGDDFIGNAHHIKIGPDGNIWIADIGKHVVRKCTPEGRVIVTLGTEGKSGCDEACLNMPTDMAITPAGDVFVADGYGNHRVVHFDKNGKYVKAWGKLGTKPGEFNLPHAIEVDSKGRLYVADRNNVRVQVFNQAGEVLDVWSNLITPWGFCITAKDEVWICGSSPMIWRDTDGALGCPPKDQVFAKFDTNGRLRQLWTIPKATDGKEQPGELNWVHAIALDSKGNIYAGDIIGMRAQKFVLKTP